MLVLINSLVSACAFFEARGKHVALAMEGIQMNNVYQYKLPDSEFFHQADVYHQLLLSPGG